MGTTRRRLLAGAAGDDEATWPYIMFTSTSENTLILKTGIIGTANYVKGPTVQYSRDAETWTRYYYGSNSFDDALTFSESQPLYLRGVGNTFFTGDYADSSGNYSKTQVVFSMRGDGKVYCRGNLLALIDYTKNVDGLYSNCFEFLFNGCPLVEAPALCVTTAGSESCQCMYQNCTSLIHAPRLEVVSISGTAQFRSMFSGCTSLVNTPDLHNFPVGSNIFSNMFSGCTSLTRVSALPTITSGCAECFISMFYNCTSLTKAPALNSMEVASKCYSSMFSGCTSLKEAPALPATTLATNCYYYMFKNCTSLKSAPVLPAKTLVQLCYYDMFDGCSSLNYVKALFTSPASFSNTYVIGTWLNGVSSTGTFVKSADATWDNSAAGIPSGWTVTTVDE